MEGTRWGNGLQQKAREKRELLNAYTMNKFFVIALNMLMATIPTWALWHLLDKALEPR